MALGCALISAWIASLWITGVLLILVVPLVAGALLLRPSAYVQIHDGDKPRTRAENIQLLGTGLAGIGTLVAIARLLLELFRS